MQRMHPAEFPASLELHPNLLGDVQEIGNKIVRRPYYEYIEKIAQTGICEVEYHGFGLWNGERLEFTAQYRIGYLPAAGTQLLEDQDILFARRRNLDLVPLLRDFMVNASDEHATDREWLNTHKLHVAALGRVMQFLDLGEQDDSSMVGWSFKHVGP